MPQVRILNSEEDLSRVQSLLKVYPLTEWDGDVDTFIKFGYTFLSEGAKSTYHVLRSLATSTYMKDKNKGYVCQASYEFLSISLSTEIRTQQRRIKELENASLIYTSKRGSSSNMYTVVCRPFPDSTFENTLRKLILRRDCLNILYNIKDKSQIENNHEEHKKLSKMYKSPFCKSLILARAPEFRPI